jgi:pyruvate formate lyase activating enzyme
MDALMDAAEPATIARAADELGCKSVPFTYNDPVIFAEYAIDTAMACRERGVRTVAVSAGYINPEPRAEFYAAMDAVNIDLKGFTEDFYHRICGAQLAKVLETIEYVATGTDTWLELTTLVIPGHNDSESELDAMTRWVVEHCGPDVPMHFSAFHPDWKMRDVPATPPTTLTRARAIAMANGVRYAYTGNVQDREGDSTICPGCHRPVVERDWYDIRAYRLCDDGRCSGCGTPIAGVFDGPAGTWGRRRLPVRIAEVVGSR